MVRTVPKYRRIRQFILRTGDLAFLFKTIIVIYLNVCISESSLLRYGSTTTGLGLNSSDADFYFSLPHQGPFDLESTVNEALRVFKTQPQLFRNFKIKYPLSGMLLNLVHMPTGIECDINFYVPYADKQSKLMGYLLHLDKRALKLAIILKIWGSIHNLKCASIDISSYSLTLLLIFYLQQKGILPPIASLQKDLEPLMVGDWNVAFNVTEYKNDNKESLYDLLGGFFQYYSTLDFKRYVLSPHVGYCIDRIKFYNLEELPDELSLYKSNIINNKVLPIKMLRITVQNSFLLTDNAMIHKNNTDGFTKLFDVIRESAELYNEQRETDFLGALLKKPDNHIYQVNPGFKTT